MSELEPSGRKGRADRRRAAVAVGGIAGTVVGGVLSAVLAAGPAASVAAPPVETTPVVAAADAPPQVAVLSRMLDAFATGSAAGPGVLQGVVATVVGSQAFPPPGDQVQGAIITGFAEVAAQIKTNGQAGVAAMQEAIAPLACANPAINQGIDAFASALDSLASSGEVIAPLDLTAAELAVLFRSFQAPESAAC